MTFGKDHYLIAKIKDLKNSLFSHAPILDESINNAMTDVSVGIQSLLEKNKKIEQQLILSEINNTLLTVSNYPDFIEAIEDGCQKLSLESLYFDFPKQEIGSDFYNPKIHLFLQTIYRLQKDFSHIIFNQDPKIRDTKRNIFLQSEIISLITKKIHFSTMSQLHKNYPNINGEDMEKTIIYNNDGSLTFVDKENIGVITAQTTQNNSLSKDEISSFMSTILTQLQRLGDMEYFKQKSNRDALTGIFNRRYLDEKLEDFERRKTPLAFFTLDGNGFKSINDTYGHDVGDEVIKLFAKNLESIINDYNQNATEPSEAVVARNGGDEFQIIIPYADEETAIKIAQEIDQRLKNNPLIHGDNIIMLGAAIGICLWDGKRIDQHFIKLSDQAMYTTKEHKNNPTYPCFTLVYADQK